MTTEPTPHPASIDALQASLITAASQQFHHYDSTTTPTPHDTSSSYLSRHIQPPPSALLHAAPTAFAPMATHQVAMMAGSMPTYLGNSNSCSNNNIIINVQLQYLTNTQLIVDNLQAMEPSSIPSTSNSSVCTASSALAEIFSDAEMESVLWGLLY